MNIKKKTIGIALLLVIVVVSVGSVKIYASQQHEKAEAVRLEKMKTAEKTKKETEQAAINRAAKATMNAKHGLGSGNPTTK